MTLTQQDIDFTKSNMADWLAEQSLGKPSAVFGKPIFHVCP